MNINNYPDRLWIEQVYLPSLYGTILYVGVAPYTAHYYKLIPESAAWHTLDMNPRAMDKKAITHTQGDFLTTDLPMYDHIALYGLWGTKGKHNEPKYIRACIQKALTILNPEGTLMIGIRWVDDVFTKQECYDFYDEIKGFEGEFKTELGKAIVFWGVKYEKCKTI
jgi:hypothetical protein